MKITKSCNGNTTTLALQGRLDTVTSTQLANELSAIFQEGVVNLVFDFAALEYISSAGLRVLLTAQKKVNALETEMKIVGANETVKEIFDITGFSRNHENQLITRAQYGLRIRKGKLGESPVSFSARNIHGTEESKKVVESLSEVYSSRFLR